MVWCIHVMSGIQCLAGQLGLFGKYPYILVPDRPSLVVVIAQWYV